MIIDMLTVNRESATPGFGNLRIRGRLTTSRGFKEAYTTIGTAVGDTGE